MKRNPWKITFILLLAVCSGTLLTSCLPRLNQVDISFQDLQLWLKDHNPFDTSITTKFVGIGLSDTETLFFPNPKTLVASAFPEESTECTGNPKNFVTLPLRSIPPQFRKCVAEIAQQTQVPILLPTKLPSSWIEKLPIYTYIREKTPHGNPNYERFQGYVIGITIRSGEYYLGLTGFISGKKITPHTPTLKVLSQDHNARFKDYTFFYPTQPVMLTNGISGYYFPRHCSMNCHTAYSRVLWEQNGYQYEIGIKMGRQEEVIEAANSAIANQL